MAKIFCNSSGDRIVELTPLTTTPSTSAAPAATSGRKTIYPGAIDDIIKQMKDMGLFGDTNLPVSGLPKYGVDAVSPTKVPAKATTTPTKRPTPPPPLPPSDIAPAVPPPPQEEDDNRLRRQQRPQPQPQPQATPQPRTIPTITRALPPSETGDRKSVV